MASRLTPRLKELRKKLGMLPIDAKQREEEQRQLELEVAKYERQSVVIIDLLELGKNHPARFGSWSTSAGDIIFFDRTRISIDLLADQYQAGDLEGLACLITEIRSKVIRPPVASVPQ